MTSTPPTVPTSGGGTAVENIEIDLVSDDEGEEIKIDATVFRVPPPSAPTPIAPTSTAPTPMAPTPLQDYQQQQQQQRVPQSNTRSFGGQQDVHVHCPTATNTSNSNNVQQQEKEQEPEEILSVGGLGTSTGPPKKVVEWGRCLVCNKGFLAVVCGIEENKETPQYLSYLLEHCLEVPPKKSRKAVKKILQKESSKEGESAEKEQQQQQVMSMVTLFCPTHETMVVEASLLSNQIMKLQEELDKKELMIRNIVNSWVAGTENQSTVEVTPQGLVVKTAVLKVYQKKKELQRSESAVEVEEKPSVAIPEQSARTSTTPTPAAPAEPKKPSNVPAQKHPEDRSKINCKKNSSEGSSKKTSNSKDQTERQKNQNGPSAAAKANNGKTPKTLTSDNQETGRVKVESSNQNVVVLTDDSDDEKVGDKTKNNCDTASATTSSRFPRPVVTVPARNKERLTTATATTTRTPNNQPQPPRESVQTFQNAPSREFQNSRNNPEPRNESGLSQHPFNYNFAEPYSSLYSPRILSSNDYHYNGNFTNKECPIPTCPEFFHTAKDRNEHYKRDHSDGIHYACFICKGLYSTFSVLQTHLSQLHDPAKPFPCKHCGKTYGTYARLKVHMQTHARRTKLQHLSNPVVQRGMQSMMSSSTSRMHPHSRPILNQGHIPRRNLPNNNVEQARSHTSSEFREPVRNLSSREINNDDINQSRNVPRVMSQPTRTPRTNNNPTRVQRKKKAQPEKTYVHECDGCGLDFDTRPELMRHKRRTCGRFAYL